MIRIEVQPTTRAGTYTASLEGRDIVTSRQPFFDAARVLLADGVSPETVIVMRWSTTGTESLTSTVAAAAKLTVEDAPNGTPRFRLHRPERWGGTSPARSIDPGPYPDSPKLSGSLSQTTSQ